jgi:hypothetical protein
MPTSAELEISFSGISWDTFHLPVVKFVEFGRLSNSVSTSTLSHGINPVPQHSVLGSRARVRYGRYNLGWYGHVNAADRKPASQWLSARAERLRCSKPRSSQRLVSGLSRGSKPASCPQSQSGLGSRAMSKGSASPWMPWACCRTGRTLTRTSSRAPATQQSEPMY